MTRPHDPVATVDSLVLRPAAVAKVGHDTDSLYHLDWIPVPRPDVEAGPDWAVFGADLPDFAAVVAAAPEVVVCPVPARASTTPTASAPRQSTRSPCCRPGRRLPN